MAKNRVALPNEEKSKSSVSGLMACFCFYPYRYSSTRQRLFRRRAIRRAGSIQRRHWSAKAECDIICLITADCQAKDIQSIRNSIEYQLLKSEISGRADPLLNLFEQLDSSKAHLSLKVNVPDRATIVVQPFREGANTEQTAAFWGKVRETAEQNEIPYRLSDDSPPIVAFDISAKD